MFDVLTSGRPEEDIKAFPMSGWNNLFGVGHFGSLVSV